MGTDRRMVEVVDDMDSPDDVAEIGRRGGARLDGLGGCGAGEGDDRDAVNRVQADESVVAARPHERGGSGAGKGQDGQMVASVLLGQDVLELPARDQVPATQRTHLPVGHGLVFEKGGCPSPHRGVAPETDLRGEDNGPGLVRR